MVLSLFNFSTDCTPSCTDDLIKAGAYKALLRTGISSFPINYKDVIESLQYSITQILFYSYQNLENEVNETINDFIENCGEYGAIFCYKPNTYVIYYNDIWPEDINNWFFLSLYACVELNLVPSRGLLVYDDKLNGIVQDFVYYLVAPDPVLTGCRILDGLSISKHCNIPLKNALEKSRRLKRKSSLTLMDNFITCRFNKFISSYPK